MKTTDDRSKTTALDWNFQMNKLERQVESLEMENYILRSRLRQLEDRMDSLEAAQLSRR